MDREAVARLRDGLAKAYQWPPSNRDAFIDECERSLPALLALADAVNSAPVGVVEGQAWARVAKANEPRQTLLVCTDSILEPKWPELQGRKVRVVALPEGE